MTSRLSTLRASAFSRQSGFCFYCKMPMWQKSSLLFQQKYGLSEEQSKQFQCTAEHLQARCDGGLDTQSNIVAACLFCNRQRHCYHVAPAPFRYLKIVSKKIKEGQWHVF